jgi:thioredoxin-related protein
LVPVKSDANTSRLWEDYYVQGSKFYVPTTVFADASGKEIGRIVGYRAPAKFQQEMDSILGDRVT